MTGKSIIAALLISKLAAAVVAKFLYGYGRRELLTIWGMTLPQVATTLAAALVGNRAGLISEDVLNSVVVMMLVTSTLGPLLVRQTAKNLPLPDEPLPTEESEDWSLSAAAKLFTVLVPVYNPNTEKYLVELAALIAKGKKGVVKPLAIANAQAQMDSPKMNELFAQREALLQTATGLGEDLDVSVEPLLRIDRHVAEGISRAAREQNAQLIVMGLGKRSGFKNRLFGSLIDNVLWASHCPLAITRLCQSPKLIRSILVPIKRFSVSEIHKVQLAMALASHRDVTVTLLHITANPPSQQQEDSAKGRLLELAGETVKDIKVVTQVIYRANVARAILQESKSHDLMIMRTRRRRTSAGGLAIGNVSSRIVRELDCSLILLGEPSSKQVGSAAPARPQKAVVRSAVS